MSRADLSRADLSGSDVASHRRDATRPEVGSCGANSNTDSDRGSSHGERDANSIELVTSGR
ncbi:hypothetical protein [Actinocrinis sp.]|uniref:hypothetical protein n=1 Tax=Actinocrinis sp. TaxID=1920516 RepID=UPI0039C8AB3A